MCICPGLGLLAFWGSHGWWAHPAALSARGVSGCSHHPQHHVPLYQLYKVRTPFVKAFILFLSHTHNMTNNQKMLVSSCWVRTKLYNLIVRLVHLFPSPTELWTALKRASPGKWPGMLRRCCRRWMTLSSTSNSPMQSWSMRRNSVFYVLSSNVKTSSKKRWEWTVKWSASEINRFWEVVLLQ